ncbi:SGNH/GDSL hydrolase family protein [bacterium]|nr:SGNH/GDSL hydrolase family protein [bacterium]
MIRCVIVIKGRSISGFILSMCLVLFINANAQENQYKIGVVGDSISAGFLTWSNKKAFPYVLSEFAKQIRKDLSLTAIDALEGRSSTEALILTKNIIQNNDINVLILELGGNDLIYHQTFDAESYKKNITSAIDYALNQNIKVVFTPTTVPNHLMESQSWFGTDKVFNLEEIELYQTTNEAICLDFEENTSFHCYPNLFYTLEKKHFFDAVHPTALGHRMIAYELLKCINGFIPPNKEDFIKELDISMVESENTASIGLGDLTNYFITKNKINLSKDLETYRFEVFENQQLCTVGEETFSFQIDSEWDNLFRFAAKDGEDKNVFEYIKRKNKRRIGSRNAVFMNKFLDVENYYLGNVEYKAEKFITLAPQILNSVCHRLSKIDKRTKIDLFEIFWSMYQLDKVATYLLTKAPDIKQQTQLKTIKQAAMTVKDRLVDRINIRFKALKLSAAITKKLYESLNPEVLEFLSENGFAVPNDYK